MVTVAKELLMRRNLVSPPRVERSWGFCSVPQPHLPWRAFRVFCFLLILLVRLSPGAAVRTLLPTLNHVVITTCSSLQLTRKLPASQFLGRRADTTPLPITPSHQCITTTHRYSFVDVIGATASNYALQKHPSMALCQLRVASATRVHKYRGPEKSFLPHRGAWIPQPGAAIGDRSTATQSDVSSDCQHVNKHVTCPDVLTSTHEPGADPVDTSTNTEVDFDMEPVASVMTGTHRLDSFPSDPPNVSEDELQQIGYSLALWLRRSSSGVGEVPGDEHYIRGITMAVNERLRMYWDILKPRQRSFISNKLSVWDFGSPSLSIQHLRADAPTPPATPATQATICKGIQHWESESESEAVSSELKREYNAHYCRYKPVWFGRQAVLKGFSPSAPRPSAPEFNHPP